MKKILIILLITIVITGTIYLLQNKKNNSTNPLNVIPTVIQKLEPKTYIMMGDIGTAAPQQIAVANSIADYCKQKDCEAVFIAGDVIYEHGVTSVDDPQFQTKFEDIYRDIHLPFYISFGNHDYLGCTQCYLDYDKKSEKWEMPASYYKKTFDDTDFFMIDTEKFNTKQQEWLQNEITNSNAKWKVVVGHRPYITYESTHYGENWSGREKLKEIICTDSELFVAGHSHVLEEVGKLEGCSVTQLISGSGGSYPRKMRENHPDEWFYEGNGFLGVTIAEEISYDFVDKEGNILHSGEITE